MLDLIATILDSSIMSRGLRLNLQRFINRRRRTALARAATDPESNPGNSLRNSKASYFPFSGRLFGLFIASYPPPHRLQKEILSRSPSPPSAAATTFGISVLICTVHTCPLWSRERAYRSTFSSGASKNVEPERRDRDDDDGGSTFARFCNIGKNIMKMRSPWGDS